MRRAGALAASLAASAAATGAMLWLWGGGQSSALTTVYRVLAFVLLLGVIAVAVHAPDAGERTLVSIPAGAAVVVAAWFAGETGAVVPAALAGFFWVFALALVSFDKSLRQPRRRAFFG